MPQLVAQGVDQGGAASDVEAGSGACPEGSRRRFHHSAPALPKADAERFYDAIADKKHGVLSWIKGRW